MHLERLAGQRDRSIDVIRACRGDLGHWLAGDRAPNEGGLAVRRVRPLAADEETVVSDRTVAGEAMLPFPGP